jgi:antitoxin (DNA-binding transcriptional repressor) of toxin-antitoxin stability system
MKTLTSREVQKNFGAVADRVTSGEVVQVTRYGRTAFFMIPETGNTAELLRRLAGEQLVKLLREAQTTEAAKSLTLEDINKLINEPTA